MSQKTNRYVLVAGLWLTALGILIFWLLFFLNFEQQEAGIFATIDRCWLSWELSFPIADLWVAITAALAGYYLLRSSEKGILLGFAAAGGMIFLALIDITYFLQNGLYRLGLDGTIELIIHLWLIVFGEFVIIMGLNHRKTFGI